MKQVRFIVLLMLIFAGTALHAQQAGRSSAPDSSGVQLHRLVVGFDRPLYATGAGDGSGRLFVVEQSGKIWILQNDQKLDTPFLDVSGLISRDVFSGGYTERGLLGLAFAPDYATSGVFYIDYTDKNGNTVIARYHVSANDPNAGDPNSAATVLTQQQPYPNHNGGQLAFGPDGYLYIGFGDGGSGGDPQGNGQNLGTWLGKILRIDVRTDPYTVPSSNPFVSQQGAKPEIWAYGLRNPWRFGFDRQTGDLYIGDVGQNNWEEVDFQPAGDPGGENYGWNIYEGMHPYSGAASPAKMVLPIAEYSHQYGVAVTGGYVYRGSKLPDLAGVYLYSDFGTGTIWYAYRDDSGTWQTGTYMGNTNRSISSFGQDDDGELYVTTYAGAVDRFEPIK